MEQLALSFTPPSQAAAAEPEEPEWVTGNYADRSGIARYLHLERAPGDPERGDIRKLPEHLRDRAAVWRRSMAKATVASFKEPMLALLADGVARTFHRIAVELFDKEANVLFEMPPDLALWELVAEERVEHTLARPILFRVRA